MTHPLGSVVTERLTRRFDRHVALRTVSVEFPPGTFTLLLGGNGSGKTTLLSILSTRLRPSRGTVRYGDVLWEEVGSQERAQIGVVGHGPMLYQELSGRENLAFFGRLHAVADLAARVEWGLDTVGMAEAADRAVGKCSRGMMQRLSIARALLHDPALLLLDEPFTGLDQPSTVSVRAALAGAKADGRTLVVVTHAPRSLADLADRVVVLRRGSVVHAGPLTGGGDEVDALMAEHVGKA